MPRGVQIGKAAEQTGLSIDTIRFYQKIGLFPDPPRTEGGYRVFGPDEIHDLQFIGKAQELGFSLNEIRQLLAVRKQGHACAPMHDLLQRKLESVRKKLQELLKLESELKSALRKCKRELNGSRASGHDCCPVLTEIERINDNRKSKYER